MSSRKNSLESVYQKLITEAKTTLTKQTAAEVSKINSKPEAAAPSAKAALPVLNPKFDISKLSFRDPLRIVDGREMPELTMEDYKRCIMRAVRTRGSLLVYGDPGVGKTNSVYAMAPHIARQSFNREFVAYHELFKKEILKDPKTGETIIDPATRKPKRVLTISDSQKLKDIMDNPEKYYLLIEVQAQTLEPVDLSGLYDIKAETPYISTKVQLWAYLASLPEAAGIIFFDEINAAPEQVMMTLMKVVSPKERMVGSEKLADDFCIIAAANLNVDTGRSVLDSALTNRFSVGFLVLDPEAWLEWAHRKGISESIIAYVKSGTEYTTKGELVTGINPTLYSPQRDASSNFPTPRQIELFDDDLKDATSNHEKEIELAIAAGHPWPSEKLLERDIMTAAGMRCGAPWQRGFQLFFQAVATFEIKELAQGNYKFRDTRQTEEEEKKNGPKYVTSLDEVDASQISHLVHYLLTHLKNYMAKRAQGAPMDEDDIDLMNAIAYALVNFSRERTRIFCNILRRDFGNEQIQQFINYMYEELPNKKLSQQVLEKVKHVGLFIKGQA